MATRAPAVRKHLSADALFSRLRTGFSTIADHRPGTPKIPLPDALMSAFALFSCGQKTQMHTAMSQWRHARLSLVCLQNDGIDPICSQNTKSAN